LPGLNERTNSPTSPFRFALPAKLRMGPQKNSVVRFHVKGCAPLTLVQNEKGSIASWPRIRVTGSSSKVSFIDQILTAAWAPPAELRTSAAVEVEIMLTISAGGRTRVAWTCSTCHLLCNRFRDEQRQQYNHKESCDPIYRHLLRLWARHPSIKILRVRRVSRCD